MLEVLDLVNNLLGYKALSILIAFFVCLYHVGAGITIVVLPPSQQVRGFLREEWFQGRIGISYFFGGQERKGCKLPHLDGEAIYIIFVEHCQS
ncbi:hypothetical protein MTO96_046867 [Rhipicephalus appendiculatus]